MKKMFLHFTYWLKCNLSHLEKYQIHMPITMQHGKIQMKEEIYQHLFLMANFMGFA